MRVAHLLVVQLLPMERGCEAVAAALQPAVQPAVLFLVFRPALREQARDCAAARAIRIRSETFPAEVFLFSGIGPVVQRSFAARRESPDDANV